MESPAIDIEDLPFVTLYQCRMCTHLIFDDIEKMFLHLDEKHGAMIDCDELKTLVYNNGLRLTPPTESSFTGEEPDLTNSCNENDNGEVGEDRKDELVTITPEIITCQNGNDDFDDEETVKYEDDDSSYQNENGDDNGIHDVKYHFNVHHGEKQLPEGDFDEVAEVAEDDVNELYDSNEGTQTTEEMLETLPQGYNYDDADDGEEYNEEYSAEVSYDGEEEYDDEQAYAEDGEVLGEEEPEEDDDNSNESYSGDNGSQQKGLLNYGYECKFCGKFFTTRRGVESHEQHHKTQTPPTPAISRPSNGRLFPCKICKKKTFHSFKELKQHVKSHTPERIHICKFCFSTFNNTASLTKHLTIHKRENPNKCFCGKTFVSANTLKIHKKIHTGVKPFVCNFHQCGRAFVTKSTLESHLRTHTGEKPYQCYFCSSSFTTSSAKYRHERHVHKAHGTA